MHDILEVGSVSVFRLKEYRVSFNLKITMHHFYPMNTTQSTFLMTDLGHASCCSLKLLLILHSRPDMKVSVVVSNLNVMALELLAGCDLQQTII
jgi:hypothetical protein